MADSGRNDQLSDLLAAVALGDQRAFATLYELTSAQLYAVALHLLRRRDRAEEVLQECFVSVWQRAGDYLPSRAAPLTWLTAIVRNRCLDSLRRPRIEEEIEDDSLLESIHDESLGPLERLLEKSDSFKLYHCMRHLSGIERQAIALSFWHGLSHSELARHLKQPLGTIKSQIRRGLQRLKACLE